MITLLAGAALAAATPAASAPTAVCDGKPFTLKKPAPKPIVSDVPVTKPLPAKAKIAVGCNQPQPQPKKAG